MAESILTFKRPGFPVETLDDSTYRTTIEYVGLVSVLAPATPPIGSTWGDYPGLIANYNLQPIEGTLYGILTVVCERGFNTGGDVTPATGTKIVNETIYEIDWVDVSRPLIEHPVFAPGGGGSSVLTELDVIELQKREVNENTAKKAEFKFDKVTLGDNAGTLTDNAKRLARGRLRGIEYWVDKAPVARQSDTWVKGPPPPRQAGQKQTPPSFPNLPTGYQWIRSADRALRDGAQSRWSSSTDWIGVKKVLIDVDEIFWT